MNLTEHLDQWLSLEGQQAKIAYLIENADPLISDEAEAELTRRLEATTATDEKNKLQEHLNMREAFRVFAEQMFMVADAFEQAQDVDDVANLVARTPDELLNQLEQRLEAALASQTGNAKAALEARLKGLRAVREAEKAFNEAKDLAQSPLERLLRKFISADNDDEARDLALANKAILLTAQAEQTINQYHSDNAGIQQRLQQRATLLRQLRLELAQPVRPQPPLPYEMEIEAGRSQSLSSDGEGVHVRQPLTYDRCQFGNNNVMINNIEPVPLEWVKPMETGNQFWEGAVGRRIELSELHQKLLDEQQCSILSVHGLPAIGKSTLAALYAHTYMHEYPGGVIWLQYRPDVTTAEEAKIELRRAAQYAYKANPEAIEILDNKYAVEPDVVQALLSGHGRLLIIVDDVWKEEVALTVRKALPADAHVLLTTRDSDVAGAFVNHRIKAMYELDVLTDADARLLLEEIAPDLPRDVVDKLVTGLDGHAQALTIAGYTLQRNAHKGADGIRADCDDILRRVRAGAGFGNLPEVKDDLRERIQKFETVLKYSYDRLAEAFEESYQPYFRALGTLADGADFPADAFAAICRVDDGAKILGELRQFGLVKMFPGTDGAPARWSQHAILRAYALSLQTPDERLDLPERYSDYVITLVQECYRSKPRDYERLEMEFAHAFHAFEWCKKEDFQKALQIVQYCNDFMMIRGRSQMLGAWQQAAIDIARLSGSQLGEANTLQSMGDLASRLGQVDDALRHYDNALTLFRAERAQLGEANTLKSMGDLASRLGQVDDALRHYDNALTLFRAERAQLGEANTLQSMGDLARRLGQVDDALRHYDNALTLFRAERAQLGEANTLKSMGDLASRLGQVDDALRHYDNALTLFRAERDQLGEANTLKSMGDLASRLGQVDDALRHYDNALTLFRAERAQLGEANTLKSMGDLASRLGQVDDALRHYDNALTLFRAERAQLGEANTLQSMGDLARRLGQVDDALRHYDNALTLFRAERAQLGEANTLQSMGDLASRLGQVDDALRHYDNALTLFRAERDQLGEANTLQSMGDLARRLGQVDDALRHYDNALTLFRAERAQLGEANTLQSMGDLARRLGQVDDALRHYDNALTLFRAERAQLGEANTLQSMGDLASRLGQVDDALRHYDNALTLFRAERDQLGEANTLKSMGDLASRLGQVDDALRHYDNALTLFRAERDQLGEANTLKSMGDLASRLGQVDDALRHYDNALTFYESERDITGKMNVFISIAHLKAEQGKIDEAKSYYERAFALADSINFGTHEVVVGWRNEYELLLAGGMPRIDPEKAQQLQALADLLIEWVKTPDWDASEAFLLEHREPLLTEDAVQALQLLIVSNDGNQTLKQHLEILKRAIDQGIEAAYAPLKQSPFEQLQELQKLVDRIENPEELQAALAMWLVLGERFLRQEDMPHDDLRQFIADLEAITLPKAEASGQSELADGCKYLLGWAYNALNIHYDKQQDYPQALAAISKAIEHQPEEAMYYRNRAGTYMDMQDYANALPDLEKAQQLEPDAQRLPALWKTYHEGTAKPDDEN